MSGDGGIDIAAPLAFLALVMASWALRPASRRLATSEKAVVARTPISVLVPAAARG